MKNFLLYCDLSTLKCTSDEINVVLDSFSESYSQVNDSLWFFKYDIKNYFSQLPKEEYIFQHYFEQFITENSIIFIEKLHDNYYYQLPDTNHDFLQQD